MCIRDRKTIHGEFESPYKLKRQHPVSVAITPDDPEHLKMEICAIDGKNHFLADKYSVEDIVSYLRIVKYQANDSIIYEGIELPNYFTEIYKLDKKK